MHSGPVHIKPPLVNTFSALSGDRLCTDSAERKKMSAIVRVSGVCVVKKKKTKSSVWKEFGIRAMEEGKIITVNKVARSV